MDREEIIALVNVSVAPTTARVDSFIEEEKESRRVMSTLLTRLTTVIAGDKEFKQLGLVDRVEEHQKIIDSFTTSKTEIKGAMRVTMFFGGVIITLINILVQIYFGAPHAH
jgi:hypothetical protein